MDSIPWVRCASGNVWLSDHVYQRGIWLLGTIQNTQSTNNSSNFFRGFYKVAFSLWKCWCLSLLEPLPVQLINMLYYLVRIIIPMWWWDEHLNMVGPEMNKCLEHCLFANRADLVWKQTCWYYEDDGQWGWWWCLQAWLFLGTLWPAYSSFKAVRTRNNQEYVSFDKHFHHHHHHCPPPHHLS